LHSEPLVKFLPSPQVVCIVLKVITAPLRTRKRTTAMETMMTTKTYLGHWLAFLGVPHHTLAQQFGLSSATVSVAIRTNERRGGWIPAVADYLGILLDTPPLDPAAREHRARALVRASARRLAKFEKAQAERERRGVPLHWKVRPPLGPRGRKANIALAVWLAAVISTGGTAVAADRPCMPGGVCCTTVGTGPSGDPDKRCYTLEEFQRYAKITCLKEDAHIVGWGSCMAANIAASKVEAAQSANAANQQRVFEARRQLQAMGVNPDQPEPPYVPRVIADEGCFMGECFREFIVSLNKEKSGLAIVKTRVEHYCDTANTISKCVAAEPDKAEYKIQCKSPGGYVEGANGSRVPEPDPNPPHAGWAARDLWTSVCHR
jgi:hypothetical protein